MQWAVELLMSIATLQKSNVPAIDTEVTWSLPDQTSTAPLVAHFGLSDTLGGFFAASEYFRIRGDTSTELPDLFSVECELFAGRLVNFDGPSNVGVQIKYSSPDSRRGLQVPVNFTRAKVDQFFTASLPSMERQLEQFFPNRGAK